MIYLHDSGDIARSCSTLCHLYDTLTSAVRQWTSIDKHTAELIDTAVSCSIALHDTSTAVVIRLK